LTIERARPRRERRVLVVDDEPGIRAAVATFLERQGCTVYTAANGEQALNALVHGFKADLIVLDLLMPVMSGWEFLDIKARDLSIKRIPTIIMTAHEHDRVQLEGVVDVFRKSNDLKALGESIERALG
jgi:two-component system response regulator CpxR